MADSSKTAGGVTEGSSKLNLPTTRKLGSSITLKRDSDIVPPQSLTPTPAQPPAPITEMPTAISKQPPIGNGTAQVSAAQVPGSRNYVKTLIGSQLGHFQIEEFVGGGGMGAVFRGTDTTLGRTVAVKVLSQGLIDEEMVRRFRHEAESAAQLDHPGIPHVYFLGEHDGWHYIVFEFIEGKNIRDYVAEQGPLSIPQALVYLADVADALQHASSREVVHRDVKPSNILVTNDGQAKLVDMGLARSEHIQSTANDLTATGVTLGTFDYISPEQARDPRNVDARSDIYSLGCTLYFMLTGKPPFPDGTMLQKLLSHTSDAPPDPSQFRDDIPPRLTELLARSLAKDPNHRQQDASELLGEILMLAEEEQITLNDDRQTQVIVERPVVRETGLLRHVPWLVPMLVLVGTAIGLQNWKVEPTPAPMLKREETVLPADDDTTETPEVIVSPKIDEVDNAGGNSIDLEYDAPVQPTENAFAPVVSPFSP